MKSLNRYHVIAPCMEKEIHYWSQKLIRRYRVSSMELEDIQQELMLHYLLHEKHYDSTRASLRTFLSNIFNNKCKDIIKQIKRLKCCREGYIASIDDWLIENNEGTIPCGQYTSQENIESNAEFNTAIRKLPEKLGTLLIYLTIYTVTEIARQMHISRSKVYSDVSCIRAILSRPQKIKISSI